ncbi:hypothetical protein HYU10_00735 [Candidatus Woesearchaeota archaeon]|nr:hypothetical protein [Candidatus Woesearchaeota archaeon]MBI2130275.1 hypothetical protein [Candidatus Woesearchaeota archaeon]
MAIEYIKTGVEGLDKILKGGLRKNSAIVVTGAPGTGKTIMALQFIYNGAKDYGENGIYITTEEDMDDLQNYAQNLGMDLMSLEKQKKIFFIQKPISTLRGGIMSMKGLLDAIRKYNVKRVALDSTIFFEYLYPKYNSHVMEYRRHILMFMGQLKKAGVTFLAVSEKSLTDLDNLRYDMVDFVFEGFIVLTRVRKGSYFERVMTVAKMRGQEHSLDIYPINIGKGGVKVLVDQTPFSLVEKQDKI